MADGGLSRGGERALRSASARASNASRAERKRRLRCWFICRPAAGEARLRRDGRRLGGRLGRQARAGRAFARGATPSIAMYKSFCGCIICGTRAGRASGAPLLSGCGERGAGRCDQERGAACLHEVVQIVENADHHLLLRHPSVVVRPRAVRAVVDHAVHVQVLRQGGGESLFFFLGVGCPSAIEGKKRSKTAWISSAPGCRFVAGLLFS